MESNLLFGAECHGVIVLFWLGPDCICVHSPQRLVFLLTIKPESPCEVSHPERDRRRKMEVHVLERINAMTTSEEVIMPGKAEK